ncbi:S8 family serine peptidase [Shewanella gaetbuli]|uniref:S8 family serine peptidase n=1 Tax=Shewanella gaetbuli TaxID=220752 RepID=A0A9X2CK26_9GAMM|nr:S8 family serine peptidase [Shewanella gaetbuli]MCL1141215.1 S8 family serine peptidase [Shewanella gaetbuli]
MNFKKCTIAMCVTSALISGAVLASTQTESTLVAFGQTQSIERTPYTFYLEQQTDLSNTNRALLQKEVEQIKQAQKAFFEQVNQIDGGNAKLISSSQLLANIVTIEVNPQNLAAIRALPGVKNVFHADRSSVVPTNQNISLENAQTNAAIASAEEIELMQPYTGSETAGAGVSVAIISTGIDYTLPIFGGSGVYGDDSDPEVPPAKGSYLDALANGAIEYDGFPTSVVVGGMDFKGENFGKDTNPIDQNYTYESWNGWEYPTGLGTELASVVHQLAPGAELHALKVYNVSPTYGSGPFVNTIIDALEYALDPNEDGDFSDHLDVVLMEASGAGAFFDIDGNAGVTPLQLLLEKVSAMGVTVVTHAGEYGEYSLRGEAQSKHRGWISIEGSPTSVMTVGAVEQNDNGDLAVPTWGVMGPVRGSLALKPEVVTHSDEQSVVKISNADETASKTGTRSGALVAAARMAAAAAVVKSHYPSFGPAEIKALLANTAVNEGIYRDDGMTMAEILSVGHGVENVDAAVSSPLIMWESESYQPYIQFGMHEVDKVKVIHKQVTIRNLSDTAQTYAVEFIQNGEKAAHEALMVNLPETVSVPANSTVKVPVSITIDGTKLPKWPLMMTADHTDANLTSTELNGFIKLTADDKPALNLGWMVKARNNTTITKRPQAMEFPKRLGWNPDLGMTEYVQLDWGQALYPSESEFGFSGYFSLVSSFVNNSQTETTFQAFPLLIHNPNEPTELEDVKGHKIRAVGATMLDDAMCTVTGKKISVAVNFFQPAQMAIANYADKIGSRLFFYDLFHEYIVKDNEWDKSFRGGSIWNDADIINQPFVELNDEGQPVTYVIDYNVEYDWTNPGARYKQASVPTYFANNGRNVVSQVCVEDLFHHELDSVEDFDQNLGFHIETDRHAGKKPGEPITQFNPVKGGYYGQIESCYFDWMTGEEVCSLSPDDRTVQVGFAAKEEGETYEDVAVKDFSRKFTAQPGEEIYIASVTAPEMFSLDGNSAPKGFMVMSSNDDFFEIGFNQYLDLDGSIIAKVADNQEFEIAENAQFQDVVGKIELDTQGFFSYGPTSYEEFELMIVNSLPGTPFAINQATGELYVQNPEALDFENQTEYKVKIQTKKGQNVGLAATVVVRVTDINDIMPEVNPDVAAKLSVPTLSFTEGGSATFGLNITGLFIEREGNPLSYSLSGDGFSSLALNGMNVVGTVAQAGSHTLTITASDGEHEVSHSVQVEAEATEKDSGGSLGWLSLILAGFIGLRRRS